MVKLLGGEIEKADLLRKIGRIEQIAGARLVKLASGKAEGIKVEKEDMGKIIGKQGKVAQAIRTLIKSIGAKEKKKIVVKFVE